MSGDIEAYCESHTSPPAPHLQTVAEATNRDMAAPQMMVGGLEGRFLEVLVHLAQPRLVVEIGTFTGYSALSMAAALPEGGRIVTCEVDERHAEAARGHIAASPYADRIEVRLGPAIDTLAAIEGPIDLVFVDADKTSYVDYYEAVLPKLAPTGTIVADNTLWSGRVIDDAADDPDTLAIRRFNDTVAGDARVVCVQLPIRDGVTLIRPV